MNRPRMLILVTLLALVAVACGSSVDDVSTTGATPAPTTSAPGSTTAPTTTDAATAAPTTTTAEFGVLEARDAAAAYFEAFNQGDPDAVFAMFESDAEFSGQFGPLGRDEWEQLLVWNTAQGTVLGTPSCLLAEELVGVSVRLVCSYGNSGAVVQAVDGPAVPIRLTLVFVPEGISAWSRIFENPSFNEVGIPFSEWMTTHHPDIAPDVEFDSWSSVEGAERNGLLTAEYAAAWRVYLDANECKYSDGC